MIACNCAVCTSLDSKDNRLRSSILIQSEKTTIVVDTTPDFRYQMLREKVQNIDAIIFTHPHKDHVAGLDDIKAYNFFQHKPMDVYANELTQTTLKREFPYIFTEDKYPGIPSIHLHTIDLEPFVIGDIPITPILVYHLKMPVLAFRFGKFTYITDANRLEQKEKDKIKGSDTLVVNALRKNTHISHFALQEAIDLVQELEIPHAYFTHISHQLGKNAEISAELPSHIHLAYDGLKLAFE